MRVIAFALRLELCHIPVIILSGTANPEETEAAVGFGAVRTITKPAEFDDLKELLSQIVDVFLPGTPAEELWAMASTDGFHLPLIE